MIGVNGGEHWLIEQSKKNPDHTAVILSSKTISYKELLEKSLDTAYNLEQLGVKPSDNIGILFAHDYKFLVLINALWFIGAIPVPLNIRLTVEEIGTQLQHAKIKFSIIDNLMQNKYSLLTFKNTIIEDRVMNQPEKISKSIFDPQVFKLKNTALIMFTSGTSGIHKAVVHTFKNLFASVNSLYNFANLSSDDNWLASLSFYHIGGFMIPVRALLTGAAVAFPNSVSTDDTIATLEEFQPSHISLVPTTLQKMIDQNVRPNKNLKYLFLGGGPSEKQLITKALSGGWPVVKVYGSTETCSMVTAFKINAANNKLASSGKPLMNCKVKIVDDIQNEIASGQIGKILVRAECIMKEYFENDTETQHKIINGWFHTGDYGRIDNDGFLFVESRREDLIISGGENISAGEVQEIILQNEKVSDAFVFGIDDSEWGQKLCAAVVSENLSEDALKTFLKLKIASYKIPKRFYFMDMIPRNEMSKVDRKKLLEKIKLS